LATLARSTKPKTGNYQLILNGTFLSCVGLCFVPTSGDSTISIEQNIRGITEIQNFRPAAGAEKLKDFWYYYYVVTLNIPLFPFITETREELLLTLVTALSA